MLQWAAELYAKILQARSQWQMPIVKVDKKVEGQPIKVGMSKGGMQAFMVGICYAKVGDQQYERPVLFLQPQGHSAPSADTVPDPEQLLSIDQLTRYSQPNAWEWDEGAIARAMDQLAASAS